MSALRNLLVVAALLAIWVGWPQPIDAQISRSDSAAVLLNAARRIEAEGNRELARDLLAFIARHFHDTPAAAEARTWLGEVRTVEARHSGRAGLTVWNTLYGAWLGTAIPAAFGADEPAPYGAGLLIGAPLGFIATKALADKYGVTSGQALAMAFGSWWGTYQGIGWRAVLDIGTREECFFNGSEQICFDTDPGRAPITAAIVGGLGGMLAAGVLAGVGNPTAGAATTVQFGAIWGTWYGLALGVLAEQEDDALLAWTLLGGNVGLVSGAVAHRYWPITTGRAWLISASGWAGAVAGLGLDLLVEVDDAQEAMVPPLVGSTVGLIIGASITNNGARYPDPPGAFGRAGALLNVSGSSWSPGLPLPAPTVLERPDAAGRSRPVIGLRIPLLSGSF